MKVRAFLAFTIPGQVRTALAHAAEDLSSLADGVSWVQPTNMHVTVRFFGEVEEALLHGPINEAIASVVTTTAPATLECSGIGVFPNWKYPKVIWAGLSGETDRLMALHDALNDALQGQSLPEDARTFRLHLTLGRVKALKAKAREAVVKRIEGLGPIQFGAVPVTELILYKSQLTKEGSVYTPLQTYSLKTSH